MFKDIQFLIDIKSYILLYILEFRLVHCISIIKHKLISNYLLNVLPTFNWYFYLIKIERYYVDLEAQYSLTQLHH